MVLCHCQSLLECLTGVSLAKLFIHVSDVQQSEMNIDNVFAVSRSRSGSRLPMISCSFSASGLFVIDCLRLLAICPALPIIRLLRDLLSESRPDGPSALLFGAASDTSDQMHMHFAHLG